MTTAPAPLLAAGRRAYRLVRPPGDAVAPSAPDPRQAEVIAHKAGPLLVVGAPGTGKTRTLIESVAARVASGDEPGRLLVLTFGRRTASALRNSIESRIGVAGGTTGEPLVRTFHAYAFGVLRRAASERGEPAPRLLSGPEQDQIIRELLADDPQRFGWPADLRAALSTRAFAAELRDLLLRAAERGLGPADLAALGETQRRADWVAAARFLREYEQVLALRDGTSRGSVAYDYAEIVRAAAAALADDAALLAGERQRLAHIYIDELADTDPAQLDLLRLVGTGQHLVAFGDPDSSTYAFRGADPAAVTRFPDIFRTPAGDAAPVITLEHAHRATPALVVAARRVSARLGGAGHHRAVIAVRSDPGTADPATADPAAADPGTADPATADPAAADRGAGIDVHTFRSATTEAAYVAGCLRRAHLLDGVPWDRMAVVMRSTTLRLPALRRALHQAGVPTMTLAEDLPMQAQPAVSPLLLLLRSALSGGRLEEDAVVALLHSPLGGADPLAERQLRQGLRALALAAGDRRPSGELLVDAIEDPTELAAVDRRWAAPAQRIGVLVATAREVAARPGATAEDVLWAVWHASGLAQRWAAESLKGGQRGATADRDLDAVVALFEAAARFVDRLPGSGVEVFVDYVLGHELPADSLAPTADRGAAVRLLTAHAAKGLEWDVVAVVGVQEGIWPNLKLRGTVLGSELLVDFLAGRAEQRAALVASQMAAILQEERRLFYVAVTRARQHLIATAVARGEGEEQPSRFLDELGADPTTDVEDLPSTRPAGQLPRALTLAALVAELRVAVANREAPAAVRAAAATHLATLAAAGVRGADPDDWWGLFSLSDDGPLVDAGESVTVTPSTLESALRCGLRWLLEKHGGGTASDAARNLGNLVHEAAATVDIDAPVDRAALVGYVMDRFDAIEMAARWMAERERGRAEDMVTKLVEWMERNPRRLVAVEREFTVGVPADGGDEPGHDVQIHGRVDRLEVDDEGRLVVIDLKTGKSAPSEREVTEHPQLGAYQVAVEGGAFADEGAEPGGAALVQLGSPQAQAREQLQPALGESGRPGWARAMVRRAAETMADSTFKAVANDSCRRCPVRSSCPVSGKGRQVTTQ